VEVEVAEEEPSGGAAAQNHAGGEPNRGGLGLALGARETEERRRGGRESREDTQAYMNRKTVATDAAGSSRSSKRRRRHRVREKTGEKERDERVREMGHGGDLTTAKSGSVWST
jgi:hypothetical protein